MSVCRVAVGIENGGKVRSLEVGHGKVQAFDKKMCKNFIITYGSMGGYGAYG